MSQFVIACNNCYETNLERNEDKIADTGQDWFICNECKSEFDLPNASYLVE